MKILHLLSTSTFSGAENVACQIIEMHRNDNDMQMVYCSLKGSIEESLKRKKIQFIGLNRMSLPKIKEVIDKYQPDIIHAHDIKASILASFFRKKCRIISHIHGNSEKMKKISVKSFLYLISARKFNHIFWVSESSLNEYRFYKYVFKNSSILQNVISIKDIIEKANCEKTEKSDVLFVGRLTEIKNPLRMINVFSEVIKMNSNAKLVIVGDGKLYDDIKNEINKKGLQNNVKMVGFQNNPYKYMKMSKILIMTSIFEGVPMCALEAMSFGLPIVATPTDGLVEIIEQNKNGFLSENDRELSKKIVELLENKDEYKKMSSRALKDARKINDIKKYKETLRKFYFN